MIHKQSAS